MRSISKLNSVFFLLLLVVACGSATSTPTGGQTWVPTQVVSVPTVETLLPTEAQPQPMAEVASPPPTEPVPQPTPEPTQPAVTPTTPPHSILLEAPQPGATVASPVQVRGQVSVTPFESTLLVRVYDGSGQVVGLSPIMLASEMGQPGSFEGVIPFQAGSGGPGRVEVAEISPKDGSVVVSASVDVVLAAGPAAGAIEIPAAGVRTTLPLHILARVGQPGEQVLASLRWQDGTELANSFVTLQGEDGHGLLIDSLDWTAESQPPEPATQPATLEIRDAAGAVLARQAIVLLSPNDPDTQEITLYFVLGESVQPMQRRIPKTAGIGTAALEELLWGPGPRNLAGFGTAIPMPEQVLDYPGRAPDWGPRVTLRKLTIVNGLATADFSREMQAYGGGSLRVMLIRQQIVETLKQFPTVSEVLIAVEGETEAVLQP